MKTIKDCFFPVLLWLMFSVVQSWICIRYTWEQNLPIAVVTVLVVFCAPILNRWRMMEEAEKRRMTAAIMFAGVILGEGYVLSAELTSWVAGRDLVAHAAESASKAAESEETRRQGEDALVKRAIAAASAPLSKSSSVVEAEINRELGKIVYTKKDQTTLGKATKDCTDQTSDHWFRCKEVIRLRPELEAARESERAAKDLKAPHVRVEGVKQTADPAVLAKYLSKTLGGRSDDWANGPLIAVALFILIIREMSLTRLPTRETVVRKVVVSPPVEVVQTDQKTDQKEVVRLSGPLKNGPPKNGPKRTRKKVVLGPPKQGGPLSKTDHQLTKQNNGLANVLEFKKPTKDQVVRLAKDGWSERAIADHFSMAKTTVHRWLTDQAVDQPERVKKT